MLRDSCSGVLCCPVVGLHDRCMSCGMPGAFASLAFCSFFVLASAVAVAEGARLLLQTIMRAVRLLDGLESSPWVGGPLAGVRVATELLLDMPHQQDAAVVGRLLEVCRAEGLIRAGPGQ